MSPSQEPPLLLFCPKSKGFACWTVQAMSDSEEELDSDEVPGFGPEQVWNACGFFVQSSDFFEKPFDGDLAYRMITTLEDRELTESDLCVELLHLTPVESSPQRGGVFSGEPPPPCSTLADCLLRRAAALGRPDTVALMLSQGARLDFDASVLEYWACLGTPLVNACEVGNVDIVCMLLDRDADTNAWTRSCQFDSVDDGFIVRMDWTALHAACAWGRLETVQTRGVRASEPSKASGSRRVYTCKKCGEPKKGHVCQVK